MMETNKNIQVISHLKEQIKITMLYYLSGIDCEDGTIKYDDDGYCGYDMFNSIEEFWKNFRTDEDFKFVVSGKFCSDGLDLEGGRSYFMNHSGIIPLLFKCMVDGYGWSKYYYMDIIYTTCSITDELLDLYDLSNEDNMTIVNENPNKMSRIFEIGEEYFLIEVFLDYKVERRMNGKRLHKVIISQNGFSKTWNFQQLVETNKLEEAIEQCKSKAQEYILNEVSTKLTQEQLILLGMGFKM